MKWAMNPINVSDNDLLQCEPPPHVLQCPIEDLKLIHLIYGDQQLESTSLKSVWVITSWDFERVVGINL